MLAPDLGKLVVMVVDDHRDSLEMFEHVLHAAGANVIVAPSALKALAVLGHLVPSTIVVNIEMPEVDGFSFVAAVRAARGTHDVPMIAISGVPFDLQPHDWQDAGFARALVKPVDPFVLCAMIRDVVNEIAATPVPAVAPTPRLRRGDLVTSGSRPGWVGEIVDVTGRRGGHVGVCWYTTSGSAVREDAEPVVDLVRVRSMSGGGAMIGSPDGMLILHRAAVAARQSSRGLRADSGRLRLHARDLRDLAAGVRAERRRVSVSRLTG
jgi:CheY-like chemotaxis protein